MSCSMTGLPLELSALPPTWRRSRRCDVAQKSGLAAAAAPDDCIRLSVGLAELDRRGGALLLDHSQLSPPVAAAAAALISVLLTPPCCLRRWPRRDSSRSAASSTTRLRTRVASRSGASFGGVSPGSGVGGSERGISRARRDSSRPCFYAS